MQQFEEKRAQYDALIQALRLDESASTTRNSRWLEQRLHQLRETYRARELELDAGKGWAAPERLRGHLRLYAHWVEEHCPTSDVRHHALSSSSSF